MPVFQRGRKSFPESSGRPVTPANGPGLVGYSGNLRARAPVLAAALRAPNPIPVAPANGPGLVGYSGNLRAGAPILAADLPVANPVPVSILRRLNMDAPTVGTAKSIYLKYPTLRKAPPDVVRMTIEAEPALDYLRKFDSTILGQPALTLPGMENLFNDFIYGHLPIKSSKELFPRIMLVIAKKVTADLNSCNLRFLDMMRLFLACDFNENSDMVEEGILKYSLKISGIRCDDGDLPLAVYFYFEEHFNIKVNIELCVRFNIGKRSLVGVILDSIQTKLQILKEAKLYRNPKVRVMDNTDLKWIMEGFCGN